MWSTGFTDDLSLQPLSQGPVLSESSIDQGPKMFPDFFISPSDEEQKNFLALRLKNDLPDNLKIEGEAKNISPHFRFPPGFTPTPFNVTRVLLMLLLLLMSVLQNFTLINNYDFKAAAWIWNVKTRVIFQPTCIQLLSGILSRLFLQRRSLHLAILVYC